MALSEMITIDREIKHPIIFQTVGRDGKAYQAAFDDEEHPTLNYDTWDEACYDMILLQEAKIEVKEPLWEFSWGPLYATRAPTTFTKKIPLSFMWSYKTEIEGQELDWQES